MSQIKYIFSRKTAELRGLITKIHSVWKNHKKVSFETMYTVDDLFNAPQKINLRLNLFKWTFACSETFWSAFQTVCKSDFLKNLYMANSLQDASFGI